jgi:conjugative relaxase-like TrwC/TraI family protein
MFGWRFQRASLWFNDFGGLLDLIYGYFTLRPITGQIDDEQIPDRIAALIALIARNITPRWIGSLAPRLGLSPSDDFRSQGARTAFENLSRGRSPTGIPLLSSSLPESTRKRRCAYDLVVAAPKSVAVAALVGGDQRVIEAHRLATATLTQEIEFRARSANRGSRGPSRAIVGAEFLHTRSRENDPHLHSHLVLFNLTRVDPALLPPSRPFPRKSLDLLRIYADSVLLDYIYKSELAFYLRAHGYPVQVYRNSPEITLVQPSNRTLFSSARARIDELERRLFGTKGNELARSWVNDRFRRSKTQAEEDLDLTQLAQTWRERMSATDRERLLLEIEQLVREQPQERKLDTSSALGTLCARRRQEALHSARRRKLLVTPRLVWQELLPLVMGLAPWVDLKPLLDKALASASREAGNSDTAKLVAYQLDLARRQLLLERITRGESVRDLVPVQEIVTGAVEEQALRKDEEEPLAHELPQRNFIPRSLKRSI